jgi:hypothetical protein
MHLPQACQSAASNFGVEGLIHILIHAATLPILIHDQFAGCIIGGAIGDAYGSSYEQGRPAAPAANTYYPFGKPAARHPWP